jgi:hypothetical protein
MNFVSHMDLIELSLRLAANDHASRGGFQGSSGIASMYIT